MAPRKRADVTTSQQRPADPAPVVLVIDDEDYVADMIASALQLEQYAVHVAYNGRQGWEMVQALTPDLVIIDLMMPYLNGETLAARIRAEPRLEHLPIILISAGARPRKLVPATAFMSKPFELLQMLALVDAKLNAAGIGNRPDEARKSQLP